MWGITIFISIMLSSISEMPLSQSPSPFGKSYPAESGLLNISLRSWRDLAHECSCFGSEAVNVSGDAVRVLVKNLTNPASYAG